MATLLLTGIGTLIGGPLGGALGALAGRGIDQAIIGSKTRHGPRLKELAVQASSYGAPIPRVYGRMRVAGTVIWATDLAEHRDKQGGGKGQPKVVTYTYSSSFAVALSSRPISGIGRIWADGNLVRGQRGDLKLPGRFRLHTGHGDQPADPLLAAAEGRNACPAFRGCAYAVFEGLQLAEFGNRIPALTFEVIADSGEPTLGDIVSDLLPEASVGSLPQAVLGFAIDNGTVADVLETISETTPLSCTSAGERLSIGSAENPGAAVAPLPAPLLPSSEQGEALVGGFKRRREPLPRARLTALRYYDVDRDYQPGVQRGRGRALPGDAATLEFPAALTAAAAHQLAEVASQRSASTRETATYRIAEVNPALAPGSFAQVAGSPEVWRINEWEWTNQAIELSLEALPYASAAQAALPGAAPGRANVAPDLTVSTTDLAAVELPWDGQGAGNSPALFAAVSSAGAGWKGAALHVVQPDGGLVAIGASGRNRAVLGRTMNALGHASPLALDRRSTLQVQLVAKDLALGDASLAQLATGANRALVGEEIIQFGRAEPLSDGRWRLSDLLRGRGGTENAATGHAAGERFVLLDDTLVPLDPQRIGDPAHARIAASGIADPEPVVAAFALAGVTLRPLSPVHGRWQVTGDGRLRLGWTRRARGAWTWPDGVDAPLGEQTESYVVTLGDLTAPQATWEPAEPMLELSAATVQQLRTAAPGASFAVRQRGSAALSLPLVLGVLN